MRTTINIPENELADAIRFTNAKTKREAVVTAIVDYNRRKRMEELLKHAGKCPGMMTVEELRAERWHRNASADHA